MTTLLTLELIEKCHAGSKAKGFWDVTPPQGQQLMLVISELAESLEAHRKGLRADKPLYDESLARIEAQVPDKHKEASWASAFMSCYKDTVEDELADAYIRLCDFAGGFDLRHSSVKRYYDLGKMTFDKYPSSFAEALLGVTKIIADSIDETSLEEGVGEAMSAIEWIAKNEAVDLATHIDLKLRYNATRPARHGKAY